MPRWVVKSGNLESEVEATDAFAACVAAVKAETGWTLGLLMEASEDGIHDDAHEYYCSTERVLEAAGESFKTDDAVQHLLMKNRH